ncbi:hypothetical protein DICSQDRAFT_139037 [Dichomitus squalens LYAD-421 SS1]|uniref:Uncharacterized protein n=1 Tax=Dichomitus squalens (strain LYAD-421) TaxID=732165 RepID=R7SRI6_DICSQ|nr:uncharacterized protein DICSQDRAFT_139037 [Dichomitus squalens LYAD-421 SS1]EJF58784.1 hypothetical protein DICSQDRAFT_139037 [Dichomitus squalens LYAD-421 SS1]
MVPVRQCLPYGGEENMFKSQLVLVVNDQSAIPSAAHPRRKAGATGCFRGLLMDMMIPQQHTA